ncbi:FAD binding domain-containing protein, partial [Pisolithus albus]
MTARTAPPVLVVGAGPTGLVAALTLARNNVPVRIIEQEPQHRHGQRGAGIQPRTFEVFHFLRVPEIHERATPILPLQEHKRGSLGPLNTFPAVDYTEPTPAIPYYNPKLMGQPTLETIIREHLAQLGYTIELGTRLISFSQDERCVRAKVVKYRSDDGEEIEEDVEAAYLIGADGVKGMIRKRLELTFLGSTLGNNYMEFGDIRLEVEGLDRDHWHVFGQTSQDAISLRPPDELGNDGWQFVVVNPSFDGQDLAQDETALVDHIKDFTGLGDDVTIKEVMWVSGFRPNIRMVNKFSVGRAFVAGDAAHVHSPAGGQGLNSGIQDAVDLTLSMSLTYHRQFNIAWKIALVYKGLSPASLLDTYATERLPVIAEMLGLTTQIHRQMFGDIGSNLERAMRREKNVYMLGVNYRSSPIVVDEFVSTPGGSVAHSAYGEMQEGVLQAGDRAPDAPSLVPVITPNPGSTRMFDIFASTHHTIIIFAPSLAVPAVQSMIVTLQEVISKELAKCVVVLPGSHSEPGGRVESRMSSGEDETIDVQVLVDQAGHAYRRYVVVVEGEIKIVVVRPDGVVGAIVRGVAGLERYFDGVF